MRSLDKDPQSSSCLSPFNAYSAMIYALMPDNTDPNSTPMCSLLKVARWKYWRHARFTAARLR